MTNNFNSASQELHKSQFHFPQATLSNMERELLCPPTSVQKKQLYFIHYLCRGFMCPHRHSCLHSLNFWLCFLHKPPFFDSREKQGDIINDIWISVFESCSLLNVASKNICDILIPRICEWYPIWKTGLCRCN